MNISEKVYANLTAQERVRAAVLATARDDEAELQVLKDTCPRKSFWMTDPDYCETMMNLFDLLVFTEYQLGACALDFQSARLFKGKNRCEIQDGALVATASLISALDQLIAEKGLDPDAMAQIGPPRHPFVTAAVTMSEGEEDPDLVECFLQSMRDHLAT